MSEGWSVSIDAVGPKDFELDEAAVDALVDALTPDHGAVSWQVGRYSACFDVDARSVEEAIAVGLRRFRAAASEAGLPEWPVVTVGAQTFEQTRELSS